MDQIIAGADLCEEGTTNVGFTGLMLGQASSGDVKVEAYDEPVYTPLYNKTAAALISDANAHFAALLADIKKSARS